MSQENRIQEIDSFADSPFVQTPELLAIAEGYRNTSLIGAEVFPIVQVASDRFRYNRYDIAEHYTVPDTAVGPKGDINDIQTRATQVVDATDDHGLLEIIPQRDIDAAATDSNYDPTGRSVQRLTDLVMLRHELLAAGVAFDPANYAAPYKLPLVGDAQWSHPDSDPVEDIVEAMEKPLATPNVMVLGVEVWTKLRRHPKIVSAVLGNSGVSGVVSRQQFAEVFELEEVLVGNARVNTSKNPSSPNLVRAWGNHALLIHRNLNADTQGGLTYGYTARYRGWIAGTSPNPRRGLHGGTDVVVGHSIKVVQSATAAAYLFENAVA